MRKRWILLLLWISVLLPLAMHFWPRDNSAVIYPFPFYEDLAIHPQSWSNLWLQRLRIFPLLIILCATLPDLRGILLAYIALEAFDVEDWFLRYGQDILVTGFDANVIKVGGLTASIFCFIIYYLTHAKKRV